MSNGPSPSDGRRPPLRLSSGDARTSLPTVEARGTRLAPHEDLYHSLLTLSWPAFFGWLTIGYLLVNAVFALAFMAAPGSVANVHGFADAFFFSVETFATIGYGVMAPQST